MMTTSPTGADALREVMVLLRKGGISPLLCDTVVPLSSCPVRCGQPAEVGDDTLDDYLLLPKSLVGSYPEMFIPAIGDSMRDAGYDEGDRLRVQLGAPVRDGDNVLASIDGCCTVKTYCQDEDGQRWLVPRNEQYDAILLREEMDVNILGRVVGVEKMSPRTPFRDCLQSIRRTRRKQQLQRQPSPVLVDAAISAMGAEVHHARQWFAVYRVLQERKVAAADTLAVFCQRVRQLLPAHGHLPEARELSRMAVLSFSKPVALWCSTNAPVSGARFAEYLRLAHRTTALLEEKTPTE